MNDKNRESLSALLDGELVDQQALEELVSQSDCNQEFAALCEQRAALHGELNPHLPTDFSAKLAQAIAQEPTVLSPVAARGGTAPANAEYSSSNVVKGRFGFRMPNLAVAAGVAACSFAAMVLFTQSQTDSGEDFLVQNPISVESAAQSSFASVAPTLSVRQEAVQPVASDVRNIDLSTLDPALRVQLIRHMEAVAAQRAANQNLRLQRTID